MSAKPSDLDRNGTFFDHLDELRRRLLVSLASVMVAALAGFCYSDRLLRLLVQPLRPDLHPVYYFSPVDAFVAKVQVALLAGLILASPIIIAQFWLFISPALHARERRLIAPLVAVTSAFFVVGVLFAFWLVMPVAIHFLLSAGPEFLKPMISMREYLSFLSGMLVAFGIAFNLPVAIAALVGSGLVRARSLWKFQRHVVVLIFIAAAVLTPGPDIASQLLLAFPLLGLFEIGFAAGYFVELSRGRRKAGRLA